MFELKMPKLGESVTEGTIGKWLKSPGDKVNKYDLLVKVQEGQTVPIGTLLAIFDTADDAVAASPAASPAGGAAADSAAASASAGSAPRSMGPAPTAASTAS